LHVCLTSALDRGEYAASRPGHFTSWEIDPGTHLVGPRAGLDAVAKRIPCSGLPIRSLVTTLTELPQTSPTELSSPEALLSRVKGSMSAEIQPR